MARANWGHSGLGNVILGSRRRSAGEACRRRQHARSGTGRRVPLAALEPRALLAGDQQPLFPGE